MRRTVVALVAALSTAGALLPASSASAEEPTPAPTEVAVPTGSTAPDGGEVAEQALDTAVELLDGGPAAAGTPAAENPEVTLALRDLLVALPDLTGAARRQAEAILARPTDPDAWDGTLGRAVTKTCNARLCVHYDNGTSSDSARTSWANQTLAVVDQVWTHLTGMGYRNPLSDGRLGDNGGDGRFDVYLKNTGAQGAYGYCSPQARASRSRAIGYCVLDNDFAEFGARPLDVLRVTAAHEFFHAVQFAHDFREDRWFMESTATWVEETFADAVNDNRNYLRFSQLRRPGTALDTFAQSGFAQYGNWIFWQFLSERHGNGIVRHTWNKATPTGRTNRYSTQALTAALRGRGGFAGNFRSYAVGNTLRGQAYDEGRAWPKPAISASWRLRAGSARRVETRINHLASRHYLARPARNLGARWRLRVAVDGPRAAASPSAVVVVRKRGGGSDRVRVRLDRQGNGRATVPFSARRVSAVTVTLINASTRFRACGSRRDANIVHSCAGVAVHDRTPFTLRFSTVRR